MPDLQPHLLKALKNRRHGQKQTIRVTPEQRAKILRIKQQTGRPFRDIFYALFSSFNRDPDRFPVINRKQNPVRMIVRLPRGAGAKALDIAWERGQSRENFYADLLTAVDEKAYICYLKEQQDRIEIVKEVFGE